ncbi:MAG TPA: kelch repeat-containing protein, partial [Dongiaceae bacterium]|nr:kelch repeat-containing protein [Dongiaceae bacterium]
MVVFGGSDSTRLLNDAWALSLSDPPAWAPLALGPTLPAARHFQAAVCDSDDQCMIVFGGQTATGPRNDAWVLDLASTENWTPLPTAGTLPSARMGGSVTFDDAGRRILMFGGTTGVAVLGDTWELDLTPDPTWQRIGAQAGPTLRSGHAAVLDPVGDRMIVFGGDSSLPLHLNDTWTWSFAGDSLWRQVARSGPRPSARVGATAIYDPVRRRMILHGGLDTNAKADTWVLPLDADTLRWAPLATVGTPPARASHSAIYDPVRDRMIVFGGINGSSMNDAWALALSGTPTWTNLAPAGTPPSRRLFHSAIYDPIRDRMLVYGGLGTIGALNDLWELSLARTPEWRPTSSGRRPTARYGHSAIYDPVGDRMIVFGGAGGGNEAWELALGTTPLTWTKLAPPGTAPTARTYHSALYDAGSDRMLVYGGQGAGDANDLWALVWGRSGVATLISLAAAEAEPGRVHVAWWVGRASHATLTLERRTAASGWAPLAALTPDATGLAAYDDRDVTAGARYGYRLTVRGGAGDGASSEAWVTVP